ncbi:hypothetical protein RJT34_02827 [Clitoria ternatea]|uniref:Uncharacterized protein n=1 Tax=Clitoria ternatea TaxID=43366 RepID=A0AAN9KLS4_CLITE
MTHVSISKQMLPKYLSDFDTCYIVTSCQLKKTKALESEASFISEGKQESICKTLKSLQFHNLKPKLAESSPIQNRFRFFRHKFFMFLDAHRPHSRSLRFFTKTFLVFFFFLQGWYVGLELL